MKILLYLLLPLLYFQCAKITAPIQGKSPHFVANSDTLFFNCAEGDTFKFKPVIKDTSNGPVTISSDWPSLIPNSGDTMKWVFTKINIGVFTIELYAINSLGIQDSLFITFNVTPTYIKPFVPLHINNYWKYRKYFQEDYRYIFDSTYMTITVLDSSSSMALLAVHDSTIHYYYDSVSIAVNDYYDTCTISDSLISCKKLTDIFNCTRFHITDLNKLPCDTNWFYSYKSRDIFMGGILEIQNVGLLYLIVPTSQDISGYYTYTLIESNVFNNNCYDCFHNAGLFNY
jgi:hypothetical protein